MRKGRVIIIYERDNEFNSEGRLTGPMLIICIAVASAGLMYGYDLGINGKSSHYPCALLVYFMGN